MLDNTEIRSRHRSVERCRSGRRSAHGRRLRATFGAALSQSSNDQFWADVKLGRLKDATANFRTAHDLLRIKLSERYEKPFPSLEETARNHESDAGVEQTKQTNEVTAADSTMSNEGSGSGDKEDLGVMRVWTDHSGRHQLQAKYLGLHRAR